MDLLHGSGGARLPWARVPATVRSAVEALVGSTVVEAVNQPGGFSPGLAATVRLADGRRVFVKAVGAELNEAAPRILRSELGVLAALPAGYPVPELLAGHDDGDWVACVLSVIDGRMPAMPWRDDELRRVLDAVADLGDVGTPSPIAVPSVQEAHGHGLSGWRRLAGGDPDVELLPATLRARVDRLAGLESRWPAAAAGDTLLHNDLRADNILLGSDRVWFVDWPYASVGAPWFDPLVMMPSVAMQGGLTAEQAWSRYRGSRHVDDDAVNAVLAAAAGYFVTQAIKPPPPNLPRIRAFQRAQGDAALGWLFDRIG